MKKLDNGCYIDGAIPRTDNEHIDILEDLVRSLEPDTLLDRPGDTEQQEVFDDYIRELENIITELLPMDQTAGWYGGDFLIIDIKDASDWR